VSIPYSSNNSHHARGSGSNDAQAGIGSASLCTNAAGSAPPLCINATGGGTLGGFGFGSNALGIGGRLGADDGCFGEAFFGVGANTGAGGGGGIGTELWDGGGPTGRPKTGGVAGATYGSNLLLIQSYTLLKLKDKGD
jgi:hypothetical protein